MASNHGDSARAARHAQACLDVVTRWERADPSPEARYWVGIAHEIKGAQLLDSGDPDGAARELGESVAVLGALSAATPDNAPYRRELWMVEYRIALSHAGTGEGRIWELGTGDLDAADAAARAALSLAEQAAERDPADARTGFELVGILDLLATIVAQRDPAGALPTYQRARAIFAGLPADMRESPDARGYEWMAQCEMAVPLAVLGRRADALAASASGLAMADQLATAPDADLVARLGPSMCHFLGARARRALGDDGAAADLLDRTAGGLRPIIATHPATPIPYVGLTETLEMLAALRPAQRCGLLDEAAAAWRTWPGQPTPATQRMAAALDAALAGCPGR